MSRYLSLSTDNKFTFVCPIFDAEVAMATCVKLRDVVYVNHPLEKRRGCQACIKSSKCPAAAMVDYYSHNASAPKNDAHGSVEPKKGKLQANVLERVARVIVREEHLRQHTVPARERELIETADARIAQQLKTAPGETIGRRDIFNELPKARKRPSMTSAEKQPAAIPKVDAATAAARSGDLAAAINAGASA